MSIDPILREWFWRIKQIQDIDDQETVAFGNVSLAIERFQELAAFLQAYLPTMRQWTTDYLDKNRVSIFIRYWGEILHDEALRTHSRINPCVLQAKQEWDSVFGKDPAASTALADSVANETRRISALSHCNDPTILAIHEGKEHKYSCEWFGCDYCEDQERAWSSELNRRLTQSSHPLLNPKKQISLSYTFREELDNVVVQPKWEPPRSIEERTPFPDEKLGQTLVQRFRGMLPILISGWSLSYQYEKDPYKQFFQLWRKLDGIMGVIQNDLLLIIDLE
jgi:hypothetical protein